MMTILAGVLSLAGVLIISRPPMLTGQESWDGDTLIGVALALGLYNLHIMKNGLPYYFYFYVNRLHGLCDEHVRHPAPPPDHVLRPAELVLRYLGQFRDALSVRVDLDVFAPNELVGRGVGDCFGRPLLHLTALHDTLLQVRNCRGHLPH